jgi:HEAT repeat protein
MLTALAHALRDSETAVRLKALDALSKGGGPFAESAVHSVLPLLEDPDPAIRLGAITVLEQIGPNAGAAMPSLKSRLADSDNAVRSRATNALLRIEPAALRQPD